MTGLDERLARALREAVPEPERTLDGGLIRANAAARARRRHRLAPALAAAAVIAVAAGVLLTLHRPAPKAHPDQPAAADSPQLITLRAVERLLAAAPDVPGATPLDSSPTAALDQPGSSPASPNVIRRTRWWTAPGSPAAALQFFRTHQPAGVTASGTSSATGGGGPTVQGLSFSASGTQWRRPAAYTELELLVSVTPLGSGVAIRVDADAIWLPQRTADQNIPLSVSAVDIVVARSGSAPTVRRTLGAATARSLATVVNHLPPATPGGISCPMDRGFTDTLVFHDRRNLVTVRAEVGGCGPVIVLVSGRTDGPILQQANVLDHAVTNALGLPPNYGQ